MPTDKSALYQRAYARLGRETPLGADCGSLCGARCCGGGEESGMLVYPGEEALLSGLPFLRLKEESLFEKPVYFAVCLGKGGCERKNRPFSCRIFPLVPYIGPQGGLRIITDPRARYICPLAADGGGVTAAFRQAVRRAVSVLCADDEIKSYITEYSAVLDEYERFTGEKR